MLETLMIIAISVQLLVIVIGSVCVYRIGQLKCHMNSRMDDLLRITAEAEFAKGKLEGESKK